MQWCISCSIVLCFCLQPYETELEEGLTNTYMSVFFLVPDSQNIAVTCYESACVKWLQCLALRINRLVGHLQAPTVLCKKYYYGLYLSIINGFLHWTW
jgi:hypothetical protein